MGGRIGNTNTVPTLLHRFGGGFCKEYKAVYDSFTTKPSASVASAQDAMVRGWVASGYWASRDQILVLAGHTNDNGESLTNWKSPGTNDATIVGSVTFVAFEGFTSAGGYINTNFNPSTDGVNMSVNDASFSIYSRTAAQDGRLVIGGNDGTNHILLYNRFTDDKTYARINSGGALDSYANTDGSGMFIVSRDVSADFDVFHNTGIKNELTQVSTALPNLNMLALTWDNNGTPDVPWSGQLSFIEFGAAQTGPEATDSIRVFDAYMRSNGKSVITEVPVFILTGQSNALGQPGSPVLSGLTESYKGIQDNIKIFWEGDYQTVNPANGTFVKMNPVYNTRHPDYTDPENVYYDAVGWSVEQEISHSLLDIYPIVYVIKSAYGGFRIAAWSNSWGTRWIELDRYITNALAYFTAQGLSPKFIGCVWLQGESDIAAEMVQADYESALTSVISNIRGIDTDLASLPFLMCEIPTDHYGDETICNTSFTNIATADANGYFIDTSAYAAGYDADVAGHYIAQNLLDLGGDLYDLIITL